MWDAAKALKLLSVLSSTTAERWPQIASGADADTHQVILAARAATLEVRRLVSPPQHPMGLHVVRGSRPARLVGRRRFHSNGPPHRGVPALPDTLLSPTANVPPPAHAYGATRCALTSRCSTTEKALSDRPVSTAFKRGAVWPVGQATRVWRDASHVRRTPTSRCGRTPAQSAVVALRSTQATSPSGPSF